MKIQPVAYRLVVCLDGVTHEVFRAELVDCQPVLAGFESRIRADGCSAQIVLMCKLLGGELGIRRQFVHPDSIVHESNETCVDCMTCLVRRAGM